MHLLFLFFMFLFTAATGSILSYGNLENADIDLGVPNSVNNPSNSNSNVQYEEISDHSDNPPWRSTRDGSVVDPKQVSPNENLYKAGWNPTKNNPCPNINTVCCHTTQYLVPLYVNPCSNNCTCSSHTKCCTFNSLCGMTHRFNC